METKFTPGPWKAGECLVMQGDTLNAIAEIYTGNHADVHLISAATDLYEAAAFDALEVFRFFRAVCSSKGEREFIDKHERSIIAALKKARGEV